MKKAYISFLAIAGVLLAAVAAFCVGFTIMSGKMHTLFTAAAYAGLSYLSFLARSEYKNNQKEDTHE